jgi:hypothetical protein
MMERERRALEDAALTAIGTARTLARRAGASNRDAGGNFYLARGIRQVRRLMEEESRAGKSPNPAGLEKRLTLNFVKGYLKALRPAKPK